MGHLLPPFPATVYYQAVSLFGYPFLSGQLMSYVNQMGRKLTLPWAELSQGGYVGFGYYQKMCRSLGLDVPYGDDLVILVDNIGWYLASYDAAENAIHFQILLPGYSPIS